MEARAILRYARISPRKVSIVMDLIRNKPLDEALAILQYTPKAACEPLLKLVNSAAANAETTSTWIATISTSQNATSAPAPRSSASCLAHRAVHTAS